MMVAPDGTAFTIHSRDTGGYCVEVMPRGGGTPRMSACFKTRAEAEQWIYDRVTGEITEPYDLLPVFTGERSPINPS